jgi:hypothetical protein
MQCERKRIAARWAEANLALFLNESVIDELEKEGFYNRRAQR